MFEFINSKENGIEVSVIIPIYNAENFIERSVYSSINQEYVKEIILVDDNSIDNSLNICLDLEMKFQNIIVLSSSDGLNKGASFSRNRGLEKATGNWIQFLDVDDELLPGKIASQASIIKESDIIVPFVVGNSIDVFVDGRKHFNKAFKDPWQGLICSKLGNSCANLYNYEFLKLVKFFDPTLKSSEEYDLMFRILRYGFYPLFDESFLTLIYKTPNSLSRNQKNVKFIVENWVMLRLRIREYLMSNSMFGFKYSFYYSAYLGMFQIDYEKNFHPSVNIFYFTSYRVLLFIKISLKRFFK